MDTWTKPAVPWFNFDPHPDSLSRVADGVPVCGQGSLGRSSCRGVAELCHRRRWPLLSGMRSWVSGRVLRNQETRLPLYHPKGDLQRSALSVWARPSTGDAVG